MCYFSKLEHIAHHKVKNKTVDTKHIAHHKVKNKTVNTNFHEHAHTHTHTHTHTHRVNMIARRGEISMMI